VPKIPKLTNHETQSVVSSRPSGPQQRKPDGRM